jgi:ATP-binding protein involved in chromosome partitioning
MSTQPNPEGLRDALRELVDPASGRDIVAAGLIDAIDVRGGLVHVALLTDRQHAAAMEPLREQVEKRLAREPGVRNVTAVLTAHTAAPAAAAGGHGHTHAQSPAAAPARPRLLEDVGAVVAVASGKGGVGKSTVAVNLAVSLAQRGLRVGLLDADIFGPSLPRMLGLSQAPEVRADRMVPLSAWGLKVMSIGFLVDEDTAMIWRGPMVMGALEQLMGQVEWGDLDIMIVDMPPGTGDAQLTMAQRVSLAGAVIVSTPQDVALADARRGVKMFERTRVPVLGLVENMSYFCCPNCGHRAEIFGHGGARAEAERLGIPFLGEVPLLLAIRTSGDAGEPIVSAEPESEAAKAFAVVAEQVWTRLQAARGSAASAGPRILMD